MQPFYCFLIVKSKVSTIMDISLYFCSFGGKITLDVYSFTQNYLLIAF